MRSRILFAVVTAVLLLAAYSVDADDKPMQDEKAKIKEVPEEFGGPVRIFGAPGGRIEIRSSVQSGGSFISRTTINGVTTLEAREGRLITRITEDPAEGVTVETTQTYDRSNMAELKDSHPNIYRYLEKAPQGMGPTKIRVTVEVGEIHQAKSVDELKEKHAKSYEIYQKYMKEGGGVRIPGIPAPRIAPPRIEPF